MLLTEVHLFNMEKDTNNCYASKPALLMITTRIPTNRERSLSPGMFPLKYSPAFLL